MGASSSKIKLVGAANGAPVTGAAMTEGTPTRKSARLHDKKRKAEKLDLADNASITKATARQRLVGRQCDGENDENDDDNDNGGSPPAQDVEGGDGPPPASQDPPVFTGADYLSLGTSWLHRDTGALYGGVQFAKQRDIYASHELIRGVSAQLKLPPSTEAQALDLLAQTTRVGIDWRGLPNASVVLAIVFDACHMHGPKTSFEQLAAAASKWKPEAFVSGTNTIGRGHNVLTQVVVHEHREKTTSDLATTLCAALAWPHQLAATVVKVALSATALGVAGRTQEIVAAACASVAVVNGFDHVTVASIIATAATENLRISSSRADSAMKLIQARGGLLFHCNVPEVWYCMPCGGDE